MPEDGVPLLEKVHTVKAETKDGEVDWRRVVLSSAWHRRKKAYKISPIGGGSGEDPSMLKSVKWLERKEQQSF